MATLTVYTYYPDACYAIVESKSGQVFNNATGLLEAYNISNLLDYLIAFAADGPPGRQKMTATVSDTIIPVFFNVTICDTGTGLAVGGSQVELDSDGNETGLIDGLTQAEGIAIIGAVVAGKITTAGTASEAFKGFNGTRTRATVTVDGTGNRTAVAYS